MRRYVLLRLHPAELRLLRRHVLRAMPRQDPFDVCSKCGEDACCPRCGEMDQCDVCEQMVCQTCGSCEQCERCCWQVCDACHVCGCDRIRGVVDQSKVPVTRRR